MSEASENRDERQLPASERKMQKAREYGQVPRSREAAHAASLIAALLTLALYGPSFAQQCLALIRSSLRIEPALAKDPQLALNAAASEAGHALLAVLPILIAPVAAACLATLGIGGLVLTLKPVTPDLNKLNPITGIGRIFSVKSLIELGKLSGIALAIGAVGFWIVADSLPRFAAYAGMPLPLALASAGEDLRLGLLWACAVVIVAAAVDGPLQVWRHRKDLMMTPAEAKQEYKETEGDPHIKGKIKERQRAMSRNRMLAAIPKANVVVTNPTHYAVALQYDEGGLGAPRVVAKGADLMAARIREIASEAGVPLLEAPPLARALYRHVELEQEIPATLYSAVAQVLAWVWQLEQFTRGRGVRPREPGIVVPAGMDPLEADR
ncbi:MAG: flagellar biosynthesis protein FlhB [Burkholderiales bacterium]